MAPDWWARGLLFENCSCQLVCPGHVHFQQLCTHDRCVGFWAIRIDAGAFEKVPLDGVKAVVVYDTPQHMITGNWTEGLIIDAGASSEQRAAVEKILSGRVGGPWAVLSRFVSQWLDVRFLPIEIHDEEITKRVSISGLLQGSIARIRGRDRTKPVMFENMFNQIHSPSQVLATGDGQFDDGRIVFSNRGTHGLYSTFEWRVSG
jgi:hypothetical protein